MQDFITSLTPALLDIAGLIVAGALTWAAAYAKQKWGLEIEAKHRDALHSALMTGVAAALSKGLTGQSVVKAAVDYARQSVPDALAKLDPPAQVLTDLVQAKIEQSLKGGK